VTDSPRSDRSPARTEVIRPRADSMDCTVALIEPRPIACWSRHPCGDGGAESSSNESCGKFVNPGGYAAVAARAFVRIGARRPYRSVSAADTGKSAVQTPSVTGPVPCRAVSPFDRSRMQRGRARRSRADGHVRTLAPCAQGGAVAGDAAADDDHSAHSFTT